MAPPASDVLLRYSRKGNPSAGQVGERKLHDCTRDLAEKLWWRPGEIYLLEVGLYYYFQVQARYRMLKASIIIAQWKNGLDDNKGAHVRRIKLQTGIRGGGMVCSTVTCVRKQQIE